MTPNEILTHVDHTILKPEATAEQVAELCREALEYNTASVCINPRFIPMAVSILGDKVAVCTVIGFPLGAMSTAAKVFEAKNAVEMGAKEVDMVVSIGDVKAGNFDAVTKEIAAIKEAVGDNILKVIIETCLLTDDEKRKLCHCVADAGAEYIKTSTGFSTAGANEHDIALFAEEINGSEINGKIKIKAAGGIKSVADMENFLALGADRLGSSSAIKLLKPLM